MAKTVLTHEVVITPGYDGRPGSDPKYRLPQMKAGVNYGIHGCEMHFRVAGPSGMVAFSLHTYWDLPHVAREQGRSSFGPSAVCVSYHAKRRRSVWDDKMSCTLLPGRDYCYNSTQYCCDDWLTTLLEEGSDGIWRRLETRYREVFGRKKSNGPV